MERAVKAAGIVAGILGLLVVVAMAARGSHPSTSGEVATRPVPNTVQDSFVTLLAIAYVVVIIAVIVGFFAYRTKFHDPESNWLKRYVLAVVLMANATAFGYFLITHTNLRKRGDGARAALTGTSTNQEGRGRVRSVPVRQAHFQWPVVFAVGGLVLLGGVWMYVRRRRSLVGSGGDDTFEAEMVAAIETTIDDLRSERDARKAVIAAYALMERTLTAHGLARRTSEAPFEYLARVLRELHVRESAVLTLTSLFEYAKFSAHEIDATMKDEAIVALLDVREDLQREEALAA